MNERQEMLLNAFIKNEDWVNKRIEGGIEAARKGNLRIKLLEENGKPLADAHIKAVQKTHDFHYGANLFLLDELPDAARNEEYRRLFPSAFNMATVPFYWDTLEPEQGKPRYAKNSKKIYRRPPIDLCLEFCRDNGITPKAHCLAYDKFRPAWVPLDAAGAKAAYYERMKDLAAHYAKDIHMWEVTNETLFKPNHNCFNTQFYSDPEHVEWCFTQADRLFPGNELVINETNCNIFEGDFANGTRSPYYMQIDRLLRGGKRVDGIGFQFHGFVKKEVEKSFADIYYDPENLFTVFDNYARFGKPLQITEITLPCYDEGAESQQLQAELIRRLYSLWFSLPLMEAVVYWNLIDGYTYVAPNSDWDENYYMGGLVNHDLSVKPAFTAIRDLFHKTWHTQTELAAPNGQALLRGFYGQYDLEIEANGRTWHKEVHLAKDTVPEMTIQL